MEHENSTEVVVDVEGEPLDLLLAGETVAVSSDTADVFAETLVRRGVRYTRVTGRTRDGDLVLFRLDPSSVGSAFLGPDDPA